MLDQGTVNYDTPDFTLNLVRSSQTVAALKPKGADGFDFTPGDLLTERSQNGYFHLGDITLRLRTARLCRLEKLFDRRGTRAGARVTRICERAGLRRSRAHPACRLSAATHQNLGRG